MEQRDSDALFWIALENILDPVFITDDQGQFLFVCPNVPHVLGYSVEEMFESGNISVFWGEDLFKLDDLNECGVISNIEAVITDKNGKPRDYLVSVKRVSILGGGILYACREITERLQVEAVLIENEIRYRGILENAQVALYKRDYQTDMYEYIGPAIYAITGYKQEEMQSMSELAIIEMVHPDDIQKIIQVQGQLIAEGGGKFSYEYRFRHCQGDFRWIKEMGQIFLDSMGKPIYCIGSVQDITERKLAEEARQSHIHFLESMEKIERVIKPAVDVEQMLRDIVKTVRTIFQSDRAWLLYPCDPESPTYRVPVIDTNPDQPSTFIPTDIEVPMKPGGDEICSAALASDRPIVFGPPPGRSIFKELSEQFGVMSQIVFAIHPRVGKPWMFGMHQCFHPRIWTEEENRLFLEIGRRIGDSLSSLLFLRDLRANEERFRTTFEHAALGIAHVALDGRWLRFNQKFCDIAGYTREELLTKTFREITHPDDLDEDLEYTRQILSGEMSTYNLEKRYIRKDGNHVWVNMTVSLVRDISAEPDYFITVVEDISARKHSEEEREKLQTQLAQVQKIEAVGRLAGGIAHDFNNMLGIIIGSTEFVLDQVDPSEPFVSDLNQIRKAAENSAELVKQLLTFARRQNVSPRVLNINEALEGMLKMMRSLIGEDIDLAWLPGPGYNPINLDPSQLNQILANLCVNARDAIKGVGKLTIATQHLTFDDAYCVENPGYIPGDFIMLSVSDSGCGMDQETISKIFEPFFTTKELGKGTGLGLAMVYGIVKQNNGFLDVTSEIDEGTTFRIYFPRHSHRYEKVKKVPSIIKGITGGQETLLIVEDEPGILSLSKRMLEKLGYRVLAAGDPNAAILLAEVFAGEIHMVMTDVVMPDMNGPDLVVRLKSLHPFIKTLYMSGYTAGDIAQKGFLMTGFPFLQKPFSLEELSVKIRSVLDQ